MNTGVQARCRRAFAVAGVAAVAVLLCAPAPTGAAPGSAVDPDDVSLRLDVKSVAHENDGSTITYIVETHDKFADQAAAFKWGIDKNGDESFDLIVFAEWEETELVAGVGDAAEEPVAEAKVSRPGPNAIKVVFKSNVLGGAESYRYGVVAEDDLNGNGEPDAGESDVAPDSGLYEHKLVAGAGAPTAAAPVLGPSLPSLPRTGQSKSTPPAVAPAEGKVNQPGAVVDEPPAATDRSAAPVAAPQAGGEAGSTPAPAGTNTVNAAPAPSPANEAAAAEAPDTLARTGMGSLLALIAGGAFIAGGVIYMAETFMPQARARR